MILTAILTLVLAATWAPLILRDLRRAVIRRRLRKLHAPLRAMQGAISAALLPSLASAVRQAAMFSAAMTEVQKTTVTANKVRLTDLQDLARKLNQTGDPR